MCISTHVKRRVNICLDKHENISVNMDSSQNNSYITSHGVSDFLIIPVHSWMTTLMSESDCDSLNFKGSDENTFSFTEPLLFYSLFWTKWSEYFYV